MERSNEGTPTPSNSTTMGNDTGIVGEDNKTLDTVTKPTTLSTVTEVTTTNTASSSKMETKNNNTDNFSNDPDSQRQIELEEERKLRAKHPSIQRPGSEFLQKRLQRGQKYFDSGDYNMAKASTNSAIKLPDNATPVTAIDSKILNKRH